MIKKFSNKIPQDETHRKITHLISSLYKIKEINRKIIYKNSELKQLVLDSELGKQVIKELKEMKMTRLMLIDYDLLFFDSILGDQFPEY